MTCNPGRRRPRTRFLEELHVGRVGASILLAAFVWNSTTFANGGASTLAAPVVTDVEGRPHSLDKACQDLGLQTEVIQAMLI